MRCFFSCNFEHLMLSLLRLKYLDVSQPNPPLIMSFLSLKYMNPLSHLALLHVFVASSIILMVTPSSNLPCLSLSASPNMWNFFLAAALSWVELQHFFLEKNTHLFSTDGWRGIKGLTQGVEFNSDVIL